MIRFFIKTCYIILLFLIFIACIIVFLLSTTAGLKTVTNLSWLYLPGTLKINHLQGSLLNHFTLKGLNYQNKTITLKINQLNGHWNPSSLRKHTLSIQWRNLQGIVSNDQQLNSPAGTLSATTTFPELALNLSAKLETAAKESWIMKSSLVGAFPWQWTLNTNLLHAKSTLTTQPGLHTQLSIRGVTSSHNQGKLVLTIHPGYYQMPENATIHELYFKGGTINCRLSPEKLSGTGSLTIDQNKIVKMEFKLPKFSMYTGLKTRQKFMGIITLEIKSLDFLQNLSSGLSKLQGQLVASLKASGTLDKAQIESKLILSKTSFYLPQSGLNIDNAELTIASKNKRWNATGFIVSADHKLSLKGNGTLDTNYTGDFSIQGTDFPVINTSEYQIYSSPLLSLHITSSTRDISGSILIPYAQIKPQTFSNSIALPDEVVYKKQQKQPPSPLNINMDITIEMGKSVEVSVKGLKGRVEGTLNIKQQPQSAMNAYGELSVKDGTYKAYGQELAIKQGQLIFTGGPINNPGISLRAAKKINNSSAYTNASQLFDFNSSNLQSVDIGSSITLGVEVTGRLSKPQIQLYSDPAIFSQADILSMLVLGRPANQANKAGGQLLLAAISSMNVGGTNSTQLLEQLKQSSGLDLNVQTNTNYNQSTNTVTDSTSFVVGKSLSKRVYLSYNIGLSQTDTNVLTLKYLLNKFFSVQISNSDTSSAIDFLYTASKKNTVSPPHHQDKNS